MPFLGRQVATKRITIGLKLSFNRVTTAGRLNRAAFQLRIDRKLREARGSFFPLRGVLRLRVEFAACGTWNGRVGATQRGNWCGTDVVAVF